MTQEDCNAWDATQFWSGEWWPGYSTVWIMNMAHRQAGLNTILSQKLYETVGGPIWMRTNVNDRSRQEWEVHSCIWNGVAQKDC